MGLWGYVSMTSPSTVYITFPLVIELPEERSLEQEPPSEISVKIRTSGWQLLYLQYFSSEKECRVDLKKSANAISQDGKIQLTKTDILQGINPSISLEKVVELLPETITLHTGMLFRQTVPVLSRVSIQPKEGFTLVGKISIQPDSIVIRGNSSIIESIRYWATQKLQLTNLSEPFSVTVPLSDSLRNLVTSAVREVTISGDVQQSAEVSINDVPVEIAGGPENSLHSVEPSRVILKVRGGVRRLSTLTSDDLKVIVYYPQLISDSSGYIQPTFIIPAGITVLGMEPGILLHRNIIKPNP